MGGGFFHSNCRQIDNSLLLQMQKKERGMTIRLYTMLAFMCAVLSVAGCNKGTDESKTNQSSVNAGVLSATTVLSTISRPEPADKSKQTSLNNTVAPEKTVLNISQVSFNSQGRGVVAIVEMDGKFHVVHNNKLGRPYTSILNPVLSPDGQRVAYPAYRDEKLRMVIDGKEGQVVEEIEPLLFSPDNRHSVYQAKTGGQWYFMVDNSRYPGFHIQHSKLGFSADSTKICYVDSADEQSKPRLVVTDLTFKKQVIKESSGSLMVMSEDKTRIAAISDINNKHINKQRVIELSFAAPENIKEGPLYDSISQLAISSDGGAVAYVAQKGGRRMLVLNDKEKPYPDGDLVGTIVFRPDNKGVAFLMAVKNRCYLHQAFYRDGTEKTNYDEVGELAYNRDGSAYAYLARKETKNKKGKSIFAVVNGRESTKFDKILTPVFSPDGKWLIYRARLDGKRFVVISDADGRVIRRLPDYEMVFQPVFTPDGKSIGYGVKDGQQLVWKVEKLQ